MPQTLVLEDEGWWLYPDFTELVPPSYLGPAVPKEKYPDTKNVKAIRLGNKLVIKRTDNGKTITISDRTELKGFGEKLDGKTILNALMGDVWYDHNLNPIPIK